MVAPRSQTVCFPTVSQRALSKKYYIVTLSRDHLFPTETTFGIANSRHKIRAWSLILILIRNNSKETQKVLIHPTQQKQTSGDQAPQQPGHGKHEELPEI